MSRSIYPSYPPEFESDGQERHLYVELNDKACTTGFLVKPIPSPNDEELPRGAIPAPITVFPSLFPRSCFEQAQSVQVPYNELYVAIAQDVPWLESIASPLAAIDDFVRQLYNIHQSIKEKGYSQPLCLGLFRSDYMINVEKDPGGTVPTIKQVEFNTIASSFGGLSTRATKLHRFLAQTEAYPQEAHHLVQLANLPENDTASQLAHGLAIAHQEYSRSIQPKRQTAVLFIVQDKERNVFDQRHLEEPLRDQYGVPSFRSIFQNVLDETSIDGDGALLYHPRHLNGRTFEISVVYYRAGYAPDEYKSKRDWDARYELERSKAIKCPTVLTQLAGMKKVQQVLATPNSPHLERFIKDPVARDRIQQTFAPIFPLDASEAGRQGRKLALDPITARNFVLKPQREGGGNNIYREKIPDFLRSRPEKEWEAYILMEMIDPPPQRNTILRNGETQTGGVICELGVYGVCLWRHDEPGKTLHNSKAGFLLRTKGDQSEEGGVAAGFGALDSPCLVPDENLG